jgi:small subunit ribosomal protein S5
VEKENYSVEDLQTQVVVDLPEEQEEELIEKIIAINRVCKVVKGGKNFSFTALVAVGNGKGKVGIGYGKANEVPQAVEKAIEAAKNSMIEIPLSKGTLPCPIIGHFGASKVILRPAAPGTGLVAGGSVRAVLESLGVKNILSKCLGSRRAQNVVYATMEGLKSIKDLKLKRTLRIMNTD